MMVPIGTSDFTWAGVTVPAIPEVGPDEEDCCVDDDGDEEAEEGEDCCVEDDDGVDDKGKDESDGDCSVEDNDGDDEEVDKRVSCTIWRESSKSVPRMGVITSVCWPVGERRSD
jgi:hypothetical protein